MNDVIVLSNERDRIALERNTIPLDSPKEVIDFHYDTAYKSRAETVEAIRQAGRFLGYFINISIDLIQLCKKNSNSEDHCEECKSLTFEIMKFDSTLSRYNELSCIARDEAEVRTLLEPTRIPLTVDQVVAKIIADFASQNPLI